MDPDMSWDADNFEPKLPTTLTSSNKWEGEDEEEVVKESWEDEEEEKKDEEKKDLAPSQPKPKKKIQDKIAEKERLEKEKAERLAAEKALEELTPEQRLAEKLRQQKLQEESDLRLAMETFGVSEGAVGKLDSFHPTSKEEFAEFGDLLCKKINLYKAKEEFPGFVDDLVKNIIVQMSSADIKRIKMTVDNLYIEKQKAEKSDKAKKPAKGKGKAKLKVEGDNAHLNQYDAYGNFDDDYDDFM
ncbi:PREDICTED: eukaryotic translation initiation factor 3 subunit J [Papilio polytes]|uniref:Eukaryotic translation initiation factor 3 subunit J n=1 Tax=Papilio polytes TaxID=76194 RepID=I4DR42_PAPPL|nr:eukaryotic translation initiation factor 3 subunit J [Papilio polytes]BAM20382.1 eukaryotic translation initiation factor 3 subunit J [Papilio polytes]